VATIEMSAAVGALILQAASTRGAAPAELARAAGFDLAHLDDPDARISLALEERLWSEAERLTGDVAIGLHAAELLQPGAFDVMDYAIRTAPSLRTALDRLVRYNRLIHDVASFSLHERGDTLRVEHAFGRAQGAQCRHSAEFTLGAVIVFATQLTGKPLRPRKVELAHAMVEAPDALRELERMFGVTPCFAQPVNALELEASVLALPLPAADPKLWRVIERHAEQLLSHVPEDTQSIGVRAQQHLSRALGEGDASLARLAKSLHMSERTLQRKLALEGIRFDALLDELRRDLSLRYLRDAKIGLGEIAYLLGYSEPSPFYRAFKRWTGMTPSEMRRRAH
jgi:AraC-like DNA-binding protein